MRAPIYAATTGSARSLQWVGLALVILASSVVLIEVKQTDAATSCVRISGGRFDAPGDDGLPSKLNGEFIHIKNYCASTRSLGHWHLHDYKRKHTYTFPATFRLRPGATVTVYSGRGTNSSTRLFWGRRSGAIWNNTPPEWAYLRTSTGTLVSRWSPFDVKPAPTPTPTPTPSPTPEPTP